MTKQTIDKGPLQEIRDHYAPRAMLEKEVMKLQNNIRKLTEEQRHLNTMRGDMHHKFEMLDDTYIKWAEFSEQIKVFATKTTMEVVQKRLDQTAKQEGVI